MKLLLALAVALLPAPAKTLTYENVVIVATAPQPIGCGIRAAWGYVDFTADGATHRAYIVCATPAKLPVIGAHCSLTVTVSSIEGATADNRKSSDGAYAVDRISCDPPI
jgi:hypothetical protein